MKKAADRFFTLDQRDGVKRKTAGPLLPDIKLNIRQNIIKKLKY